MGVFRTQPMPRQEEELSGYRKPKSIEKECSEVPAERGGEEGRGDSGNR